MGGPATLEISNTTPAAKIYANEGIAQILFIGADEICKVSYKDKKASTRDKDQSHYRRQCKHLLYIFWNFYRS